MEKNLMLPRIALLFAAMIWGAGFIGVEGAINGGWSAFQILLVRSFIGGFILFVFTIKSKWWEDRKIIRCGIISGFFLWVGFAFQTFGQALSTPSKTAFITALYVVIVPFITRMIYKKKLPIDVYVAAVLGVIGVALLTLNNGLQIAFGDVLIIISSISFAFHIFSLEYFSHIENKIAYTAMQLFTMAVLSLFGLLVMRDFSIPTTGYDSMLFVAIFPTAVAFFIQTYAQAKVSASTTSLLLSFESVFGSLFSVIIFHELLSGNMIIGGLSLFLAVLVAELKPLSKKS